MHRQFRLISSAIERLLPLEILEGSNLVTGFMIYSYCSSFTLLCFCNDIDSVRTYSE